jgi:uncharacterized phage protein (TIGR01671 family)
MMGREIRFRAWDKNERVMVDWLCMVQTAFNRTGDQSYGIMYMILSGNHHNFEVMQYTGLKDKNGKEIYEGDLWERDQFIGFVEFSFSGWNFKKAEYSGCYSYPSFYSNAEFGEVIGNIHENPDLVKD